MPDREHRGIAVMRGVAANDNPGSGSGAGSGAEARLEIAVLTSDPLFVDKVSAIAAAAFLALAFWLAAGGGGKQRLEGGITAELAGLDTVEEAWTRRSGERLAAIEGRLREMEAANRRLGDENTRLHQHATTHPMLTRVRSICRKISELTERRYGSLEQEVLVRRLNRLVLGWVECFILDQVHPAHTRINQHAVRRLLKDPTARYNTTPALIKTFVGVPCLTGAVCKSSGRVLVGITREYDITRKHVWLQLRKQDWKRLLNR